jgi:hypothetical protein
MYTKEFFYTNDANNEIWAILDPDGDYICTVIGELAADALLSHLNRQ